MAIKVKPIGQIVSLWTSRSVAAMPEYKSGVQSAGQDWQQGVDNAEDNWVQGVNTAAGNDSYSKGVAGKASKYVDRAVNLGSQRYGSGVQAAANAYQGQMTKVASEIAQIDLPPRMPAGSNSGRSTAISDRLHQAKVAGRFV